MRNATSEEVKSVNDYIDSISQTVLTIPIPDNATNGDMIKALFPNANIFIEEDCPHIINISLGYFVQSFQDNWWNAPYKKESEEV